ncbi:MAG: prepilin-type N-terminal cleavage/methylation domain-containing protein [Magnetococcales bacterium]|nr:prepilin-type N-terminal cleavage/methylation domain-containing protein [Magnetococcales bacterium]
MKSHLFKRSDRGFSLLELAIGIVIIGMVVSAVAVGRNTMRSGEAFKAYQQFINPWTQSAIQRYQNTGLSGFGTTGGLNSDPYNFGGGTITRQSATYAEGMVTVVFALSSEMRVDALEELQGVIENGFESARRIDFSQENISVAFELAGVNQTTGSEVETVADAGGGDEPAEPQDLNEVIDFYFSDEDVIDFAKANLQGALDQAATIPFVPVRFAAEEDTSGTYLTAHPDGSVELYIVDDLSDHSADAKTETIIFAPGEFTF